ncbi:SRPBCC family protein [Ornithinimicrobium sp. INDO-MA30-4]|uniref:SRPBCC family protein n=1 Tax=Ornithinimicrobium sp. INDO-MA30-4 TaxID=2908651 RepID=UPI001F2D2218|nr:SRPBCC family protein [Ornithinimicrobium sp. INDO-MA30-4]UJH71305.1 SRPBCC family protein [Ornithinimicrobium sp. INDO-MA30-4]
MPDLTESTVVIDALPGTVVGVIADFETYPEWAREVQRVEVLSHEGDGWADRVRFEMNAGILKDTYVLDYAWEIGNAGVGSMSWEMVESKALRALSGSYEIVEHDRGTLLTYRLTVVPQVPMLGALRRKAEKMIVATALTALQKRAVQVHTLRQSGESE